MCGGNPDPREKGDAPIPGGLGEPPRVAPPLDMGDILGYNRVGLRPKGELSAQAGSLTVGEVCELERVLHLSEAGRGRNSLSVLLMVKRFLTESLIMAQDERWRRA
jgi:hypothetical protein